MTHLITTGPSRHYFVPTGRDIVARHAPVEDWKLSLEARCHVGAVLMDLSKAFDCLPHQLIIAKLRAYGMNSNSAALMWSYLSNHFQQVKLAGN